MMTRDEVKKLREYTAEMRQWGQRHTDAAELVDKLLEDAAGLYAMLPSRRIGESTETVMDNPFILLS